MLPRTVVGFGLVVVLCNFATAAGLKRETLQKLKDATVFVRVTTSQDDSTSGSGFLAHRDDERGYVVTNAHVARPEGKEAKGIEVVFHSGTRKARRFANAQLVDYDTACDLAVLRFAAKDLPTPLELGTEDDLVETMPLFLLGYPFGELLQTLETTPAVTVSKGSLSSLRLDKFDRVQILQLDTSINPGNSGGPVVDESGTVVGVAVAKVATTQIGFATPADQLRQILNGRVAKISWQAATSDKKQVVLTATGTLIDPLQRVTALRLAIGPGETFADPDPPKDGAWPALEGQTQVIEAKLEGKAFTAQVTLPLKGKSISIAYQPELVREKTHSLGAPEKLALDVNHTPTAPVVTVLTPQELSLRHYRDKFVKIVSRDYKIPQAKAMDEQLTVERQQHSGADIRLAIAPIAGIKSAVFSPTGDRLYVASADAALNVFSIPQLKHLQHLQSPVPIAHLFMVEAGLAMQVHSKPSNEVWLLDPRTLEPLQASRYVSQHPPAFCQSHSRIYVAAEGGGIVVTDLTSGDIVEAYSSIDLNVDRWIGDRRNDAIYELVLAPDSTQLFALSDAGLTKFAVKKGVLERAGHTRLPRQGQNEVKHRGLICSPDGSLVAVGCSMFQRDLPPSLEVAGFTAADLKPAFLFDRSPPFADWDWDLKERKLYALNTARTIYEVYTTDSILNNAYHHFLQGDDITNQIMIVPHPAGNAFASLGGKHLSYIEIPPGNPATIAPKQPTHTWRKP
jgi:hypothetical protein